MSETPKNRGLTVEKPDPDLITIALPRDAWREVDTALVSVLGFARVTHHIDVESRPLRRIEWFSDLLASALKTLPVPPTGQPPLTGSAHV